MSEKPLFSLADDVAGGLRELLPLLEGALHDVQREWDSLSTEDIEWYGSERALASVRWMGRLMTLTWALEEFCVELGPSRGHREQTLRGAVARVVRELKERTPLSVHQESGEHVWAWCEGFADGSKVASEQLERVLAENRGL